MLQGVNIGAFDKGAGTFAELQPVIGKTPAVGAGVDLEVEGELALHGHLRAIDLVGAAVREVEIEEGALRKVQDHQLFQKSRRMRFTDLPWHEARAVLVEIGLAQGKGAHALHRALDGAGDRAGIGHVVGNVRARIDAGEHEVRLDVHYLPDAHDDAIGRRAAQREMLVGNLAQPQRFGKAQRMGKAALVRLGRDDPDIVRERARDPLQRGEPFGMNAVIIRKQDAHRLRPPVRSSSIHPYKAAKRPES